MTQTTVTLKATASTRTQQSKPSAALSASAQSLLTINGTTAFSYLQFGLPRDLVGATVIDAYIELEATAAATGVPSAQLVNKAFGSNTTWNNQPTPLAGSTLRTGALVSGSTTKYRIPVTADFATVAAGAAYFGHRISTSTSGNRTYRGRTHATLYPRLVLTYATATPTPSDIKPYGSVSLAAPVFTWAAPAGTTLVQAQADAVGGNFTAPTWTSPEWPSTIGQIDTAARGWSGLANGASAALRFRQSGPLGWGPWSAPVTITRRTYATLTATAPTPGGVTNDPTPPHAWTFSGQAKFQLLVFYGDKLLYDSSQVSGSDQAWTPVVPTIGVPDGASLRSVLRVWDTRADRVASPGDPGYVETSWTWVFNSTIDTASVENFSASVRADRPIPVLRFSRSAIPDELIVERNGVLLRRYDGTYGKATSSNQWTIEDETCPPNTAVTYRVYAVVANKVSKPSPAQLVECVATGVFLYDAESAVYLNVAGEAASDDLGYVENTVTYKGPFAQAGIKRVLSLGGIEGTVTGLLHRVGDRPIRDQVSAAKFIRSHARRTYRLIYGFTNIPVLVSGVSPTIDSSAMLDVVTANGVEPYQDMTHRIRFEVAQNGEFETTPAGEE